MKNICNLLFILILLFSNAVFAEELPQENVTEETPIYLDNIETKYQMPSNKNFSSNLNEVDSSQIKADAKKYDSYVKNDGVYDMNNQYKAKNASFKNEKKFKNFTVGTESDSSFTANEVKQKNSVYSTYELNKKMSVKGAYTTNTVNGAGNQFQGTMAVTPQFKINDKFSINNTYSKNLSDDSNKEEVSLKYNPFKDNRMDFNVGAGQVQYSNGSPSSSQVNMGANFRF